MGMPRVCRARKVEAPARQTCKRKKQWFETRKAFSGRRTARTAGNDPVSTGWWFGSFSNLFDHFREAPGEQSEPVVAQDSAQ